VLVANAFVATMLLNLGGSLESLLEASRAAAAEDEDMFEAFNDHSMKTE